MSSRHKRAKKEVGKYNRAVVRQFAEWIDVCSFRLRLKVAIKIIRGKL